MSDKTTGAQQAILDAFWKLYRQKPLDQIMVTEVTRAAHVHRSTFYRHFTNLHDALECIEAQVVEAIASELEAALPTEAEADEQGSMDASALSDALQGIIEHEAERVFFLRLRGERRFEQQLVDYSSGLLRQLLRPDLDEDVADYLCALSISMLLTSAAYLYELSGSGVEPVARQTAMGAFMGNVLPCAK